MGGSLSAETPYVPNEAGSRGDGSACLRFNETEVGLRARFTHQVTEADVKLFVSLSGDANPLHVDPSFAAETPFGRPVVHGMLLGCLVSRLVGMHLPGRYCLYLSQSLNFVRPVYVGDCLEVCGEVLEKHEATQTVVIRTEIYAARDRLVLRGKAHVQVMR